MSTILPEGLFSKKVKIFGVEKSENPPI